jgi:hypothetical protein
MGERRRTWIKGCFIGCGSFAAIIGLALLAVTLRTCAPLSSANRARSELDERFGPPASYRPTPDGVIPEERLRVFLGVRDELREPCERFEAMWTKMQRVENLDEQMASGREVASTTKGMASVSMGIAPFLGEFFDQRNNALLDAGMGLGEYSYIFVVVYRDQLHDESIHDELFFEGGLSPEVLATLRSVIANQRDASADVPPSLEQEIRSMAENLERLPWAEGLPDTLATSLAPYRERLDESYCGGTAGIAMDQGSGRAMKIALY